MNMLKRWVLLGVIGVFLLGILGVAGCFGSGGGDNPDPLDVTGTWIIEMFADFPTIAEFPTMIADLSYSVSTITGSVADTDGVSTGISGWTTAPAGAEKPRTLELTITVTGGDITLSGSVGNNNDRMSGLYTDSFGGSGNWTARKE
jgi:hypothetical protein